MSLFHGTVSLPLITNIDGNRVIRTIERLRIPANGEAIFRARIPQNTPYNSGITETLPEILGQGLKVASTLVDCSGEAINCRIANPNPRPVIWPAGYAFAYVNPLDPGVAGVNLIDLPDLNITRERQPLHTEASGVPDDDKAGPTRNGCEMPPHEERLSPPRAGCANGCRSTDAGPGSATV